MNFKNILQKITKGSEIHFLIHYQLAMKIMLTQSFWKA